MPILSLNFLSTGHGNSNTLKIPTRVIIGKIRQVACGCSHTLALSDDFYTVYSFGSGDGGKLGHGDTTKQLSPKVQCTCMYIVAIVCVIMSHCEPHCITIVCNIMCHYVSSLVMMSHNAS